jgi:RimJ/RimL family protein N-acetyltransferase
MDELLTERLRLRMWVPLDFEAFAGYFADPEASRFLGGVRGGETAWRLMAAYVGHWVLRGFGYWAMEERGSGRFCGAAGLWRSEGWPELELGYWLVPEMQGQGYATEAARRCRDHAFEALGAETLVSYIAPANEPSMRVAERLGGRREGAIELLDYGRHEVYRYGSP